MCVYMKYIYIYMKYMYIYMKYVCIYMNNNIYEIYMYIFQRRRLKQKRFEKV